MTFTLLRGKNGDLTYNEFLAFSHKMAIAIGIPPRRFTPHAYRKGGITDMFNMGYDIAEIQEFGKWKQISSVATYIVPDNPFLHLFCDPQEYFQLCKKQGHDARESQTKQLNVIKKLKTKQLQMLSGHKNISKNKLILLNKDKKANANKFTYNWITAGNTDFSEPNLNKLRKFELNNPPICFNNNKN